MLGVCIHIFIICVCMSMSIYYLCVLYVWHPLPLQVEQKEGTYHFVGITCDEFVRVFFWGGEHGSNKTIPPNKFLMDECTGGSQQQPQQHQQQWGRRRRPSVDPSCYGAKQGGKPIARLRTEVGKEGRSGSKRRGGGDGMGWGD